MSSTETLSDLAQILLTGLVAGATVVLGVALTEGLARLRARRERIEGWIAELAMTIPRYLIHFTGRSNYPQPSGPEFQQLSEDVIRAMSGIRFNARFPLRRRARIIDEVEDLSARVTAVFLRFNKGTPVTSEEILNISVGPLRSATLGKEHDPLEDRYETYINNGIASERAPS